MIKNMHTTSFINYLRRRMRHWALRSRQVSADLREHHVKIACDFRDFARKEAQNLQDGGAL
jgi:hypothetical protein